MIDMQMNLKYCFGPKDIFQEFNRLYIIFVNFLQLRWCAEATGVEDCHDIIKHTRYPAVSKRIVIVPKQ